MNSLVDVHFLISLFLYSIVITTKEMIENELCFKRCQVTLKDGGGQGGGSPREKGTGGVREEGEEGTESRILKVAGITQHCAKLRNQKSAKRREPTKIGQEPGLEEYGKREP